MKLSVAFNLTAAFLSTYYIVQLPYIISICFLIALLVTTLIGLFRRLDTAIYIAFFGLLILSTIMGGYYADVNAVGGTLLPQMLIGIIGRIIIASELSKPRT